jgi:hypothetical protein
MRGRWAELFGVDLRSLALFRIALAALLLVDLARRAEAGVLPVETPHAAELSLHVLLGPSALAVAALFALAEAQRFETVEIVLVSERTLPVGAMPLGGGSQR